MTRHNLEDELRKTVHLYTDAGDRAAYSRPALEAKMGTLESLLRDLVGRDDIREEYGVRIEAGLAQLETLEDSERILRRALETQSKHLVETRMEAVLQRSALRAVVRALREALRGVVALSETMPCGIMEPGTYDPEDPSPEDVITLTTSEIHRIACEALTAPQKNAKKGGADDLPMD